MQVAWTFKNPRSHGVITAIVTDKKYRWLLIGTSRGIFTLWDLRFRIQLKSWVHPTKSRISKLLLHPQAGSKQRWWVIVAAGKNEVSVWDVEKVECKEVFGVRNGNEKMGGVSLDMFKVCYYKSFEIHIFVLIYFRFFSFRLQILLDQVIY